MKKFCSTLVVVPFLIFLCACNRTGPPDDHSIDYCEQTKSISVQSETITIENFGESEMFRQMTDIIYDSFSAFSPSINYDKDNALVNVIVTASDGTVDALEGNTLNALDAWEIMVSSLSELSKSGYELLSDEGLQIGCTVMLLSDKDPENALFAALNGVVVYNVMQE